MKCIVCGSKDLDCVFRLENAPRYTQKVLSSLDGQTFFGQTVALLKCSSCGMVQVDPETICHDGYWEDYLNSRACTELYVAYDSYHAARFADKFSLKGKKIVEVGCGDGYFLEQLREHGAVVEAIEPSIRAAEILREKNIPVYNTYANDNIGDLVTTKFDGFVCRQVLDLVKDPTNVLTNISTLLKPGACGLVDVPSLSKLLLDYRYYSILPDRVGYFSAATLLSMLERNGFHVLEIFHGAEDEYVGAYFIYQGKEDGLFASFNEHFGGFQRTYSELTRSFADRKLRVGAWGAGAKGVTIFSMMRSTPNDVLYVVDKDKSRWNHYLPGSGIRIVEPDSIAREPVDVMIITASMFFKEITAELVIKYGFTGEIVSLSPIPRIVPKEEIDSILREHKASI